MKAQDLPADYPHILHLEDDSLTGDLTRIALKKEWPGAKILRVGTRDEFLAALKQSEPDLILSDYTIPGFGGMAALELARQLKPDIPYVFFSGTIGEDRAVEALKRGATDYVIKDRPQRLISSVRRVLEEGRGRRDPTVISLANEIAHNFKNAFGPILLALPLIRQLPLDGQMCRLLENVETSANRGTNLIRQLQAFVRQEESRIYHEPGEGGTERSGAGREGGPRRTILVIDDIEALRNAAKVLLEALGYKVILCHSGVEAVATYEVRRTEVDAVLTDLTMPGMGGKAVIEKLEAINPDVRIVVMSGMGKPSEWIEEAGRRSFITKPMTRATLLHALQEVLTV